MDTRAESQFIDMPRFAVLENHVQVRKASTVGKNAFVTLGKESHDGGALPRCLGIHCGIGRTRSAGMPGALPKEAPQALKRCLWNLLDDAVKYGKRARVAVDDNDERLEIRIQDEGPGIPPSEIGKVFEPFYRVESSRSRETGGTGLGLSIAKGIAEDHGGRLEVHNRAGGGLEALLILPRQP